MNRQTWVAVAAVGVTVATTVAAVISRTTQATQAAQEPPPNTAPVTKGTLTAMVSLNGTLTYRARSDGSPYSVINQAVGRYTQLPYDGDKVACGDVLYRVNNNPVLLLCGTLPAYRDLYFGDVGDDVRQLNWNLHSLGYDAAAGAAVDPNDNAFTLNTEKALAMLRHARSFAVTGALAIGDAVFLPESVRIARVTGAVDGSGQPPTQILLGGVAQPGTQVLLATSDALEVQVNLDASQQGEVKETDPAEITLPGNRSVTGKVDRLGTVAQVPAGQNTNPGAATIPAYISLDHPDATSGLDKAPVQVAITTDGVESALSVPVTALVGKSGGGFAVEVVRDGGQRELVPVELGLFDTADGRVQIDGEVAEGDRVVVPTL